MRAITVLAVLCASVCALAFGAATAGARVVAHAAGTCTLPGEGRTEGPTYVERLTVSGTTCSAGIALIKAYNACRLKHGGAAGTCTSKIDGYSFSEKRQSSSIQFVALVVAKNGKKTVDFTYSENT